MGECDQENTEKILDLFYELVSFHDAGLIYEKGKPTKTKQKGLSKKSLYVYIANTRLVGR